MRAAISLSAPLFQANSIKYSSVSGGAASNDFGLAVRRLSASAAILAAAVKAGARWAGYVPLRLPFGIKGLFETWLQQHFPERKDKVLNRLRAFRGGKLNDPRFGTRMRGEGVFAEQLESLFVLSCRKAGLTSPRPELSRLQMEIRLPVRALGQSLQGYRLADSGVSIRENPGESQGDARRDR